MKKHLLLILILYALFSWGSVFADACMLNWQSSDLDIGTEGPKNYYGDTNIAYAIFSFPSDSSTVYRIKGAFPNARYMSIESSELIEIGSWDFDAIQDWEIIPDDDNYNPFNPGIDLDASPKNYTVHAIPPGFDGGWLPEDNRLEFPTNGNTNQIWLRIVAPNLDQEPITLPTIEALDLLGNPKACSAAQVTNLSVPADQLGSFGLPGAMYANEGFDPPSVSQLEDLDLEEVILQLLKWLVPQKWWVFPFRVIDIPFEGSAAIPGYSYGLTKINPRRVALVKFKAPSFVDTSAGTGLVDPNEDLRYWSLCSLDLERGKGLACIPDYQTVEVDSEGFVTIVYGPKGGVVEWKAQALGYNFLPDNREALGVPEQPVAFVYRQLLPSTEFSERGLHQGDYVPRARVCSEWFFLLGWCRIR